MHLSTSRRHTGNPPRLSTLTTLHLIGLPKGGDATFGKEKENIFPIEPDIAFIQFQLAAGTWKRRRQTLTVSRRAGSRLYAP